MSGYVRPMTKAQHERDLREQRESIRRYLDVRQADQSKLAEDLKQAAYRSFKEQQPHIWERKHARLMEISEEIMRCNHALLYIDQMLYAGAAEEQQPEPSYPYDPGTNTFAIPAHLWLQAERLMQGEADDAPDQPEGNPGASERRRVPALIRNPGGRSA